ncbi:MULTISPECIES: hypothetical protein [unclassified Rhizobium]|uniref:hypothetical protein n=1 Tax=unclassified Rhizobium TaxID=2613769 RepID=UPI001ADCFBE1|nr:MULTISPECIES: hypothetical protein [unclassified Rhizobium]MBO9099432.1 hypothetical protein [Rhizobium sp. L58/93]QXZ87082.1 hypothetical protein J5287_21075 [Rhizobium sp. K1/93]QXZ92884.1 hypothetical protein J5280_19820 [Rhizobium sp. K15/93]
MNPLAYLTAAGGAAIGALVVWLFMSMVTVPNAETAARTGYVLLAEKTTAEAAAAEMTRQRNAASLALSEAEKRKAAADIADQATQAQTDLEMADYEKKLTTANRRCLVDDADVRFLQSH